MKHLYGRRSPTPSTTLSCLLASLLKRCTGLVGALSFVSNAKTACSFQPRTDCLWLFIPSKSCFAFLHGFLILVCGYVFHYLLLTPSSLMTTKCLPLMWPWWILLHLSPWLLAHWPLQPSAPTCSLHLRLVWSLCRPTTGPACCFHSSFWPFLKMLALHSHSCSCSESTSHLLKLPTSDTMFLLPSTLVDNYFSPC